MSHHRSERKLKDLKPVGFASKTLSEIWNRGGLVRVSVRDKTKICYSMTGDRTTSCSGGGFEKRRV